MKNFTFETQGANTYLVYEISENENIDTLSLGMITHNKISGILPVVYTQIDNNKYLKYNISSKIPVKQFFSSVVNKKRLLGVLYSIAEGILAAEEYMIEPSSLIFDLEYIYADVSTCEAYMICLPILDKGTKAVDIGTFYKNIVFSIQFDQTENCDYVAKLISYLNSNSVFSLVDFKQILFDLMNDNIQRKNVMPIQPAENEQKQVVRAQTTGVNSHVQDLRKTEPVVNQSNNNFAVPKTSTPKVNVPENKPNKANKPINVGFEIPGMDNGAAAFQKKEPEKGKVKVEKPKKEGKSLFSFFTKKSKKSDDANAVENNLRIPTQEQGYVQPTFNVQNQPNTQKSISVPPVSQQESKLNFGETTVLSGLKLDETIVLGGESLIVRPYIIRIKNNEKIYIDKPVFRIGKERSFVDYYIPDNPAVSRSHANIITRDNNYFVVDTNSKNHTYVDGVMIQSNIEIKIEHGTKLMFANEEFEFRLY
ncbi:DUF6382 domain-containing protein [Acetivibrio clariflavus]|uniref:DUF6382 domain-containing protein n=1 Tax=Acetivibrio clariflavus TaxID=288965 RepID=UPI0031F4C8AF